MIIDFLPHSGGGGASHSHDHSSHGHDHGHSHNHGKSHDHAGHSHGHGKATSSTLQKSAIHTVAHHGFKLEDVKQMFEDAGAGNGFEVVELGGAIVFSTTEKDEDGNEVEELVKEADGKEFKRVVFMARGVK